MDPALETVRPSECAGWNALVAGHPDATPFHSAEWTEVLRRAYGYEPTALLAAPGGRLAACVPLVEVRSPLAGRRGVSLPFSDFCPPLLTPEADPGAVRDALLDFGRRRGWRTLELRGGRSLFPEATPSLRYAGHRLSLEGGEAGLWKRLRGPVRTALRKARRAPLRVEISTGADALRAFDRLHALTRRRHGLPPPPASFFEEVRRVLFAADLGFVVLARSGGRPAAAALFLLLGRAALFKYGASDPAFQEFRPNDLVLWEGLLACAARGGAAVSLGKTRPDHAGLLQFKRGWGGEEHPIEYVRLDLRRNVFLQDDDRVAGWHNAVFRRLPLPLLRACGALLYRHMA